MCGLALSNQAVWRKLPSVLGSCDFPWLMACLKVQCMLTWRTCEWTVVSLIETQTHIYPHPYLNLMMWGPGNMASQSSSVLTIQAPPYTHESCFSVSQLCRGQKRKLQSCSPWCGETKRNESWSVCSFLFSPSLSLTLPLWTAALRLITFSGHDLLCSQ